MCSAVSRPAVRGHPPPGQGVLGGGLSSHEADHLPVSSADGKK